MTGERSSARVEANLPLPIEPAGAASGVFSFDNPPGARVAVVVAESTWTSAGKAVLAAAGIDEADPAELESTFLEVLQQSLSPLAQAIGPLAGGREVNARGWVKTDTPETLSDWVGLVLELRGERLGELWLSAGAELTAVLRIQPASKPEASQPEADVLASPAIARGSKTLDLLLEVEMPVGVSFGRTQMRLKDAVKLSTGSIVELNRTITEPVEIIVNNCVIARGEVVVVEGNYGVRIKEIISREERLRTLF
jgi:flagellar motor switch protein FliN/FliY